MSSRSHQYVLEGPNVKNIYENMTLGQFFYEFSQKYKNNICQLNVMTGESETYGEFHRRAVSLASHLMTWGITPADVLLSCCTSNLDSSVVIAATFYVGAIIAHIDPTLVSRQVTHYIGEVTPKIIFVDESALELMELTIEELNLDCKIIVYGITDRYISFSDLMYLQKNIEKFKPIVVDVKQMVLISFSSGTTGLPKCVCHSHFNLMHMVTRFFSSGFDHSSILTTLSYHWQIIFGLFVCAFGLGGCRYFTTNPESEHIFQVIDHFHIGSMFVTPSSAIKLLQFTNSIKYDRTSLKHLLSGGSSLTPNQYEQISHLFPKSTFIFIYGLSEIGSATGFNPLTQSKLIKAKIGSCGPLLANLKAKIIDINSNKIVGPNHKGEIYLKSASIMIGYYKTNSQDVFDDEGFFRTGDFGYYDDDYCFYVIERIKEMFVYKNWNILPSVVETVLLSHHEILEAVVFGTPTDDAQGSIPTACVVLRPDAQVTSDDIRAYVASRVHDKECLRGGVFICSELQKTITGKVMRKEMQLKYANHHHAVLQSKGSSTKK